MSLNKNTRICIILYGTGLCGSCPPGKKLLSLKNNPDILYLVPAEFNDVTIYNLKETFMLSGTIMRGNNEIEKLLKNVSACQKLSEWQNNIYLELSEDSEITKIYKF